MFFIKKKKKDEPIITLGISEASPITKEEEEKSVNEDYEVVEEVEEVVEYVEEEETTENEEENVEVNEEENDIKKRVLEKHAKFFKETLEEVPYSEVEEEEEVEEVIEEEEVESEEALENVEEEIKDETPKEEYIFGEEIEEEETIQCPYCLRYIPKSTKRCEFCGNLLTSHGTTDELKSHGIQDNTEILEKGKQPTVTAETTVFLPAKLCLISPEDETVERIFTLSMGKTSIGRGPSNKLSFPDETFISRHHCTITYKKFQYVIKDLNSANGTYVNDIKIKETVLRDGDIIQIGALRFLFEDPMEQQKKKRK